MAGIDSLRHLLRAPCTADLLPGSGYQLVLVHNLGRQPAGRQEQGSRTEGSCSNGCSWSPRRGSLWPLC